MIKITKKTIYIGSKRLQNQFNSNTLESRFGVNTLQKRMDGIAPIKWVKKNRLTPKQQGKKAHVNQKSTKVSQVIRNKNIISKLWQELEKLLPKSH